MKITEDMRFPHPVLSKHTGDYPDGKFDVVLDLGEPGDRNQVSLVYTVDVTEASIADMLRRRVAGIGLFVTCADTYLSELIEIDFPRGKTSFRPGDLVGTVSARPLIWSRRDIRDAVIPGLHPEFGTSASFGRGAVLAMDDEWRFTIDPPNMPTFESIFVLVRSDALSPGRIEVDLDAEKITIRTCPRTYRRLSLLRGSPEGRIVTLNSVYLPAVMDVLEYLRENRDGHADRRWKQPFLSRCDSVSVNLDTGSLFEAAQRILEFPAKDLGRDEDEG